MADVRKAELKLACTDHALAYCETIPDLVKISLQKKYSIDLDRTLLVSNFLSSVTSIH